MITVAERRRLEELIDAYGTAITEWAATPAANAPESWHASYRELQAYLDELTDYATHEARDPDRPLAG